VDLWGFSTQPSLPQEEEIEKMVEKINNSKLFLSKEDNKVLIEGEGENRFAVV
jgi:thiamine biosynthesis lipoprotein ApbE